jgi:predicted heme/steroid binding protein
MKKYFIKLIIFIFIISIFPTGSFGTEEYSKETGKTCKVCHINPAGGGDLTEKGENFKKSLQLKGFYKPLTTIQKIVRFIIGYLHIMTAIIWFGTIFYVHLILKPAYAVKGLPKGELLVGWVSIIVIAITGTLLTIAKVPSLNILFHTKFGILLLIKIGLFLLMATSAAIVTFVIGPRLKKIREIKIQSNKRDFNIEELAQFNGKENRPAYIAYKGNIYEVTHSKLWKDGSHLKKHHAGFDLTDMIAQAPHGEEKILSMPLVGKLIKTDKGKMSFYEKAFYFFAYMNLIFIFLIIFVISLWRWW